MITAIRWPDLKRQARKAGQGGHMTVQFGELIYKHARENLSMTREHTAELYALYVDANNAVRHRKPIPTSGKSFAAQVSKLDRWRQVAQDDLIGRLVARAKSEGRQSTHEDVVRVLRAYLRDGWIDEALNPGETLEAGGAMP